VTVSFLAETPEEAADKIISQLPMDWQIG